MRHGNTWYKYGLKDMSKHHIPTEFFWTKYQVHTAFHQQFYQNHQTLKAPQWLNRLWRPAPRVSISSQICCHGKDFTKGVKNHERPFMPSKGTLSNGSRYAIFMSCCEKKKKKTANSMTTKRWKKNAKKTSKTLRLLNQEPAHSKR